ncbi:hypothetical protein GBA52_001253 [Prunus armeniaca]|nr:hypothetical protein GBA52_001253 [Prunus armeniaca]
MEWRKCYLDVILVPLGFLITASYHAWLWYKVRNEPQSTIIGINTNGRRFWVSAMMKDNEKKKYLGRPNASEHNHGVNPNGHHLNPSMLWHSSSDKQHIQCEETAQRRRLRGSRRIHGGSKIRDPTHTLSLRIHVPLTFNQVHKPSEHPNQQSTRPHVLGHLRVRV